jgi:hypothetical protein
MKNLTVILVSFSLTALLGCATTSELSSSQQAFLAAAMATPLTFTLPQDQAEAAWTRAQTFVQRFSTMKLQALTPHVIRTYDSTGTSPAFGYYLRKVPKGGETQFTVECMCSNMFPSDQSIENAHLLAYYMKTGNLDPELVNR